MQASKQIKEHLDKHPTNPISYFEPKSDKFSTKTIRKRKFEARNRVVQHSTQSSEIINKVLGEYWNSPPATCSLKKFVQSIGV